jgi:hypothetical protein
MTLDKEALHWRRIREVLNTDWDPIGAGCPEDEYDSYIGMIAAMLREGASDGVLGVFLRWAEIENMGLSQQPDREQRIDRVIARLRAISAANGGAT